MTTPAKVGATGTVSIVAAATVTPAFAQATTAGNLLVACAVGNANAAIASSSTGWLSAAALNDVTNVEAVAIFYKPNCGASETAPTLTCAGAAAMHAFLTEWSGAATASPVDQTGTAHGTGTGGAASTATATGTDIATDDLVISCGAFDFSMGTTTTFTYSGTAGTKLTDSGGVSRTLFITSGYNNGGATGVSADTGSITPSTGTSGATLCIVSFSAASVGFDVPLLQPPAQANVYRM